jgi:hypothetical protein
MAVEGKKWIETIKLPGAIIAAANGASIGLQQFWNWLFPDRAVSKQWVLVFMGVSVLAVVIGFIAEHIISDHHPDPDKEKNRNKSDVLGEGDSKRRNFEDYVQEARKDADRVRKETRNS